MSVSDIYKKLNCAVTSTAAIFEDWRLHLDQARKYILLGEIIGLTTLIAML